ncbi:hypothetical protein EYR36_002005 [Pleurotus pulmonarius]|nr:hypothetical protein EYR36_002005 [Pleurotus pulmonarius]
MMFKLTAIVLTLVTLNAVYVASTPVIRYAELDDSGEGPAKRWAPLGPYYMPPAPFGYRMRPHMPVTTPSAPGETSATSTSTNPTESPRPIPTPTETESASSRSTRVPFPTAVPQHSLHPLDDSKSTQSQLPSFGKDKDIAQTSTQVSQPTETESHHWPELYNRPWAHIPPVRPWYPRPWYSRRRGEILDYDEEVHDKDWVGEERY